MNDTQNCYKLGRHLLTLFKQGCYENSIQCENGVILIEGVELLIQVDKYESLGYWPCSISECKDKSNCPYETKNIGWIEIFGYNNLEEFMGGVSKVIKVSPMKHDIMDTNKVVPGSFESGKRR